VTAVAVAFAAMFAGPAAGVAGAAWVAAAYLAMATVFAFFQAPYTAMPAEITTGDAERTRLMSWRVAGISTTVLLTGALAPAVVRRRAAACRGTGRWAS
jgi:Na+/melibiose symporter-like transporter